MGEQYDPAITFIGVVVNRLNIVLDVIDSITSYLGTKASYIVLLLVASLVYEVISRYIFNSPTIWSYEVTYMAYGTHFLIGLSFALLNKAHIRIDVFYEHYPEKVKAIVDALGYLLVFFPVIIIMTISGYGFAAEAYRNQEVSQFTPWAPLLWPFKTVIALGFGLLLLQGFAEFLRNLKKAINGENNG